MNKIGREMKAGDQIKDGRKEKNTLYKAGHIIWYKVNRDPIHFGRFFYPLIRAPIRKNLMLAL